MGPETWLGFFVPDPWRTGDGGGVDVATLGGREPGNRG